MSATLDTGLFSAFFGGAIVIKVPGRTFPVSTYFLEDVLEGTGHVIEADSMYAQRDMSDRTTVSMWVTTRSGEKRRENADYEKDMGVSDNYPTYSLNTRRYVLLSY
jgi:ATP-dependent RNA helicase DHX29